MDGFNNIICGHIIMSQSQYIKTIASSMKKVAELPRYQHPADLVNPFTRPIRQQNMEINGEIEFGTNSYESIAHEKLVQELIGTRNKYRTESIANRLNYASKEYSLWNDYLKQLVAEIPKEELIEGKKLNKVFESYLIAKERNHEQMQLSKTVKLFYHLSRGFQFDIRLHPMIMLRMVHPHLGYLNNFTQKRLSFDDYVYFLHELVAVSQIWQRGSTLHGSEMLSFVFWKLQANKPTMKVQQFTKFLHLFKFNTTPETFTSDFKYSVGEGEVKEESVVRFQLWRKIFLERGL